MELFLKLNKPNGKKFRLRKLGGGFDKGFGIVVLYPDQGVEVEDHYAKRLLLQDPDLVSKTPYETPNLPESEQSSAPQTERELLVAFAEVEDPMSLKKTDLVAFADGFELEYSDKATKKELVELIELHCTKLVNPPSGDE